MLTCQIIGVTSEEMGVDGRKPPPVGMYETPQILKKNIYQLDKLSLARFYESSTPFHQI